MLEKEKSLDAVIVSTPDHLHAVIAATAIRMGKHVYCQKPLMQTVYEARLLRKLAKEYGVVTQMGNQGSAEDGLRRAVEVVQAGLIGPVREVHVWSNRPIWPQGMDRPAGQDPVPATLDWDLWLGPAPPSFKDSYPSPSAATRQSQAPTGVYHTFNWRGWQDFGTGALGDMACHTANMPFRALKLGYPTEVEAECLRHQQGNLSAKTPRSASSSPPAKACPPLDLLVVRRRSKRQSQPPMATTDRRHREVECDGKVPGSGCLLVGDKGKLFSPDDYGANFFVKLKDEKELIDGQQPRRPSRPFPKPFRATPSKATPTSAITSNGSPPAKAANPPTRTSTSPLTSPKSSCSAASPCASARNWNGTARTCAPRTPPKPPSSSAANRKGWAI